MAIPEGAAPGDVERGRLRSATSGVSAVAVVNADGSQIAAANSIWTLAYDYIGATYPNSTTEQYVSRVGGAGGSVQQTVTVVYTDSTKANVSTVTRS